MAYENPRVAAKGLVKVRVISDYQVDRSTIYKVGEEIEVPKSELDRCPWAFVNLAEEAKAKEAVRIAIGQAQLDHEKIKAGFKADREASKQALLIRARREAEAAQERLALLEAEVKGATKKDS